MNTQHTPGPWTFTRREDYRNVSFYVAQQDDAPYTPDYSDVATLIAETARSEREIIQEANARLIAAAPDLLAALQVVLRDYTAVHDIGDVEMQPALYQARAAITKATGEQA
jgi:hypothetical protein